MSIADHFDHAPDAGLIRNYDSGAARRQFNLSLILIVVIAAAATALGILVRFDSPVPAASMTASTSAPSYAGHL